MSRDGASTRQRLMRAAEQLFAEQGIDRVQLCDINQLAGQRNESALHYHFGSRQGLLTAVLARHGDDVQRRARQLLETVPEAEEDELRFLIGVLVVPLSEKLRTDDGRHYLRILAQTFDRSSLPQEGVLSAPWVAEPIRLCLDRIEASLAGLPEGLRRERTGRLSELVLISMAGRARRLQQGGSLVVDEPTFVVNLIEMAVAALRAPIPS